MRPAVLLCVAPVLSVLRPALGPSTLKAALESAGIAAEVLYLNLHFAEACGVETNEWLAEDVPTHLLVGDWLFAHLLAGAEPAGAAAHAQTLREHAGPARWRELLRLRARSEGFIAGLARHVHTRGAAVVGFSSMFQQTAASLALAAQLKRLAPDTHICFGGANCHGPMGPALLQRYGQIDSVFTGNAEAVFAAFTRGVLDGRPRPVPGAVLRGGSEAARPAPPARLDQAPVPDHSDYFRYLRGSTLGAQLRPAVPFESSRGCWWGQKHHCTFCGLNSDSMAFNAKPAPQVLDELAQLAQRHGVARFCAADNIMALEHIEQVFGVLESRSPGWRFFYEIKSNLSEARLRTLARGGVTWVQPGIESLDDRVLQIMRKGVTALANIRLLRNCTELGMGAVWNILYGFPHEPADAYARMARLLPLLQHLRPPTSCSRIRIDRFSPNYEQSAAMGFSQVRPAPAYAALYGGDAAWLEQVAYFFEGTPPQGEQFGYADALRAAVQDWRDSWYRHEEVPELRLERLGPAALVKDTRRCAVQALHLLPPAAVALLDGCRDPAPVSRLLQHNAAAHPDSDAEADFARLVELGLVLVDGNAALSLPVDGADTVIDAAGRADFPWGHVLPAPADAAARRAELPT
ncbi:RiPP maturation radical SAM C-methyltransferase [Tahibacter harae]|uniref:RiPP maturation radical SAM C-methyltransferase n=1 Tax=Tahibacter harae TaxID=2963937 RepID=A0ABT1QTF1_9GAMM|nr:RiPP maturation radical SAM C-methyltransferase [Tahibacter harae]